MVKLEGWKSQKLKWLKFLKSEIDSQLTYQISISRDIEDDEAILTVVIRQKICEDDYDTNQRRSRLLFTQFQPIDLGYDEKFK